MIGILLPMFNNVRKLIGTTIVTSHSQYSTNHLILQIKQILIIPVQRQ
ncbi:hypothetical protein H1P_1210005 [Hyella patelloides LEGE 07179]|uniref:Uncharacterized protein n=1 Tax=Hyella patelloides LEGE 07179 TaxID=945734 RepID=A0A563VK57_9CYAN|nr:hypothetical protein H1P_1210005 [Hyella patelloides LEGE 07179]